MQTYKIRWIRKKLSSGITSPAACTLDATLKFDSQESPHCVYNEHVALRLAQTLHIPVADGALTNTGAGHAYASLQIDSPGLMLPDMLKSQIPDIARSYEEQVGALVAFDIFIGNWDRGRNIKASVTTPHIRVFRAFDHEHALLGIEGDPAQSINRLRGGDLIVSNHPFYDHVSSLYLVRWVDRIRKIPDQYIQECCNLWRDFRAVAASFQKELGHALCKRKILLPDIIQNNQHTIRAKS